MTRTEALLLAPLLAMTLLMAVDASAAGRGPPAPGVAPAFRPQAAARLNRLATVRQPGLNHRVAGAGHFGRRFGDHRRLGLWGGGGWGWPGYYGQDNLGPQTIQQTISLHGESDSGGCDSPACGGVATVVGIPNPPTPTPTLYRIEGRRDRPVVRVIRFADAEPADERRGRYRQAEIGALPLAVPGR